MGPEKKVGEAEQMEAKIGYKQSDWINFHHNQKKRAYKIGPPRIRGKEHKWIERVEMKSYLNPTRTLRLGKRD